MSKRREKIVLFFATLVIIFLIGQHTIWTYVSSSELSLPANVSPDSKAENTENFTLGWYDIMNQPQNPQKIAKQGFKSVIPYGGSSDRMINTYLNAARAANIQVFLPVNPDLDRVKVGDISSIKQKINKYKDNQVVYGWYIADEPDFKRIPPQYLESVYQAIKEEDTRRPIAIAFNSNPHLINKYRNAFDILMYDKYPCRDGYPEFSRNQPGVTMEFTKKRIQQLGRYADSNNKAFFPILQGFGQPYDPQNVRRFCTQSEERYLIYTSILSGADGLFFWAYYASKPSWINAVLNPLIKELNVYLPAIDNNLSSSPIQSNNTNLEGRLYQKPNSQEYFVITVNHSSKTINANLKLAANFNHASANVITEKRLLDLHDGILHDSFQPHEVHVYYIFSIS